MLSKQFRFSARLRLQQPLVIRSPLFTMRIAKNNKENSRFSVVVSKAVDKSAVLRNRTKRVMLGCISEVLPKITPGYDVVIHMKKSVENDSDKNLQKTLVQSLSKGKLTQ